MIDTFYPAYSENSVHATVSIGGDGKRFLEVLKSTLLGCGWTVAQTNPGRAIGVSVNPPVTPPYAPGESHGTSPIGCPLSVDGQIGTKYWKFYDPLRQSPAGGSGCTNLAGKDVIWVATGTNYLATAANLGAALSTVYGALFVGLDTASLPAGQVYMLYDDGPMEACDVGIFGLAGPIGGVASYSDPYYVVANPSLSTFAVGGAGWEMVSPDGGMYVELSYRVDGVNPAAPGLLGRVNSCAPYLRVRPSGGTYQFLYPFSTSVGTYHFHASEKQLIIWGEGYQGPLGRPTNIIISELAIPDDPPVFMGANLARVILVVGSLISGDGSWFSGDTNTQTAQARDRLWYVRGNALDFYSFTEGENYSQTHTPSAGLGGGFADGWIGHIFRGLDNGRDLRFTNGEPLIQTPWISVPQVRGAAPSYVVGRLWDAMLLSTGAGAVIEGNLEAVDKKWRLLTAQRAGGVNLNASLWLTALNEAEN